MAKTVLFVPKPEMIAKAEKAAANYNLNFLYMKTITSFEAETEAAQAIAAGAELIIARGLTAIKIKKVVTVPVVEISLTGQELGQLVQKVKREIGLDRPRIGLVGFRNMFCDISSFDELYEVEIREYFVRNFEELETATRQAQAEAMDVLIGGDEVCRVARIIGQPAYFITSGGESIAEACRVAEQVAYAIDQEKKNTALLKTLLDYSFNGIIKVDRRGEIEYVNHVVEKFFGMPEHDMQGQPLARLLPAIGERMLEQALNQGEPVYSTAMTVRKTVLLTSIAPLVFDGEIQGAIVSFHEGRKLIEMEAEMRRELYHAGFVAKCTFDSFVAVSASARETAVLARSYAASRAPVLILGDDAAEKEMLAQCIHNASAWAGGPFVTCACDSLPPEALSEWLYGSDRPGATPYAPKGLVDLAEGGVLFLERVSLLDEYAQYRLLRLLTSRTVIRTGDIRPQPADLRIIAADSLALMERVKQGLFREDLYHALNVLPLALAPLQQRPEDAASWIERSISELEKSYGRFIHLTADASRVLDGIGWDGGLPQIRSFCERLVALAPRRTVDEATIRRLLQQTGPSLRHGRTAGPESPQPEGQLDRQIVELLQKYRGNRRLVAEELSISTTTLWRYMKRLGISDRPGQR